jgi:sugar-specific transcriptional regulator TrmB
LDEEKILSFDRKVKEYSHQINGLFDDIQKSIDLIEDKEEYLKSEDELKREIKDLKAKQIYKSNKLSEIIELAQETLKSLEQGQQKYEMFHDL